MKTEISTIKQKLEEHREELVSNYFATLLDTFTIKVDTMRGNTARAYRKEGEKPGCYLEYTPSSIFKFWLHKYYFGDAEIVSALKEGSDFKTIHESAIKSLEAFWRETEKRATGLQFYHFAKLIDLLFKSIPRWKELPNERREWFFQNANVPLDKYSLLILKECHPKYSNIKPSMNFVTSEKHYFEIQKDIKEMIAPFPPMLFDLYAWDYRRKELIEEEKTFELEKAK